MNELLRRRKNRHHIDTTIVYSDTETKRFKSATMYNFNTGGVYFEADNKVEAGTDIIIKLGNYMPGPYSPEGFDTYHAKVRWCNEIEGSSNFGVGAEIT